jgi:hypothetical protein
LGYQNIYVDDNERILIKEETKSLSEFINLVGGNFPGFATTTRTRPLYTAQFKLDVVKYQLAYHSVRLADELDVWIYKNGRADHMDGFHDDLIMSFAIGSFVREKVYVMALELQRYIEQKPYIAARVRNTYKIFDDTKEAYDEKGRQKLTDDIFDSVNKRPNR